MTYEKLEAIKNALVYYINALHIFSKYLGWPLLKFMSKIIIIIINKNKKNYLIISKYHKCALPPLT